MNKVAFNSCNFILLKWNGWIAKQQLNSLQVFAKIFSVIIFFYYLVRIFDWNFLFSPLAFIPKDFVSVFYKQVYQPPVYYFPNTEWVAYAMYGSAMLVFLYSVFKTCPMVLKIFAWIVHLMFFYRNLPTVYGGDLVLNAFFVFYVFSEVKNPYIQKFLIFAAQVQLIMIYFNSGVMKFHGQTWMHGSAIGLITANDYIGLFRINLIENLPILSAILSWMVLAFEVGAPFGFFVQKTKKIWLVFGVLLHLGIAFYMGLWFFSMQMVAAYVFFLNYPGLAYSSSPSEPMASTGQPSKAS